MQKYLVVEIEHNRYAKFLTLDNENSEELNLTTLVDNQRKADVKIYIVFEGKKQLFYSFSVSPIPGKRAGEPRLLLSGTFDGKHKVHLSLRVNGKHWASKDLSIKKYTSRRKNLLLVFLLGLILVLALTAALFLRGCGPAEEEESPSSTYTADQSDDTTRTDEPSEEPQHEESSEEPSEDIRDEEPQEKTSQESAPETAERDSSDDQDTGEEQDPELIPEDATIYFEPDLSSITPEAEEKLSRLAEELTEIPSAELKITGHCALYGTEQGRIELSRERARAVEDYLYKHGWSPETPPEVTGVGGREPLSKDPERQHLNRRVEISVD
ncbi:MAG: OmpA family protein [Spirochaetia bacterium]